MARGSTPPSTRPRTEEGAGDGDLGRTRYRRRWLVTFLLVAGLSTAWSLITPPGGGPDETAHAIKAAAVTGGELTGDPYPAIGGGARAVEAPGYLNDTDPVCFAFQPTVAADCRPSESSPAGDVETVTNSGVSPPAYYALVGAPLRLVRSFDGVYVARLVSGLIAAAFVATALQLAATARSRFLAVGVAVAWTPMAASLSGVINPSTLEISSGVLVWVAGLLLVRPHALPAWLDRRLIWHFGAAATLFALSRQISPPFLAVIVVVLALGAPWARLREIATDRRTWAAAGVVAVAALFASGWLVAYPVGETTTDAATAVGGRHAVSASLGYLGALYEQAIGIFGWLDAAPPSGVVLAWTMAIGVLGVVGAAVASRRLLLALVATVGATVGVPAVLGAAQMPEYGILFQGRYVLPLGVGIVIVAGRAIDEAIDEAGGDLGARLSRAVPIVLALTVIGHLVAIWFAARRFAVGTNGPVWFFGEGWSPGIPLVLPLALALLVVPTFAVWCWYTPLVPAVDGAGDDRSTDQDADGAATEAPVGNGSTVDRTAVERVAPSPAGR